MSERAQPIVITGFMGAGKTTVAAALARRLACSMIDLDQLIKEREGRTPQVIIDEDGEPPFREIESRALRAALDNSDARVIALGGGTWMLSDNRALIKEHNALTIWLDAPFAMCWLRILHDAALRPLAVTEERARRLFDERLPLYALAAWRVQVVPEKSADEMARQISERVLREAKSEL